MKPRLQFRKRPFRLLLRGRDIIGTAQTGTGKTAAFVLPILQRLLDGPRGMPRALIVTPTRELAEQINQVVHALSAGTRLRSATIYGGVTASRQIKALRDGVEILVATPGRLLDLMQQRHAKLDRIEVLVLDEGDRMFDMGFLPDVKRIIKAVPVKRQTMLFSATFPPEVELLVAQSLTDPQRISMGLSRPAHTVTHALYPVPAHLKSALLLKLLKQTDTEFGAGLYTHETSRRKIGAPDRACGLSCHQPAQQPHAGTTPAGAQWFQERALPHHGCHRHRGTRSRY